MVRQGNFIYTDMLYILGSSVCCIDHKKKTKEPQKAENKQNNKNKKLSKRRSNHLQLTVIKYESPSRLKRSKSSEINKMQVKQTYEKCLNTVIN